MRLPKRPQQAAEFSLDCTDQACRLTMRPVRPDDGARLAELFAQMSPTARRQRFHGATRGLSAQALLSMSCVDFEHDSAWVVSRFDADGTGDSEGKSSEALVAEARWHLDDDNPAGDSGEFAIAVADGMQQHGLGRRLMRMLEQDAAAHGVRCLHGDVLSGNAAMLALMQRCGYELGGYERPIAGDTVRVEHRLPPPAMTAGVRQRLREVWVQLIGRFGGVMAIALSIARRRRARYTPR